MDSPMEQAIEAYHALLEDREVVGTSLDQLRAGQHERNLYFGEHPLSMSLRPRLISEQFWQRAVRAAESVYGALATLEGALLAEPELRAELDLTPEEEPLALAEPGCRHSSPSARLDSFFDDEVRYVEYNAESPAGMAYGDVLAETFEELEVMRRFRERFRVRGLPSRRSQADCMLRAFDEWGGADKPSIAIVDWPGLPTVSEFLLFQEYFAAQGVECGIYEPAALSYDRGKLRAPDGRELNLVYRRVLTSELLARPDEAKALCEAYLEGAIVMVNTFRAKLLHKKMSLALLSDERYRSLYSPAEQAAIDRHIPWTRRLRHGRSTGPSSAGTPPIDDLAEYVASSRQNLVLKPNDEYGGKGVVLGWTVDDSEWEATIEAALHQTYVVQEAVPIPREPYPVAVGRGEDRSVQMVDLAVDMDPYLYEGAVTGGVLTRLSSSALLNVTAGEGSVVPTFVVSAK